MVLSLKRLVLPWRFITSLWFICLSETMHLKLCAFSCKAMLWGSFFCMGELIRWFPIAIGAGTRIWPLWVDKWRSNPAASFCCSQVVASIIEPKGIDWRISWRFWRGRVQPLPAEHWSRQWTIQQRFCRSDRSWFCGCPLSDSSASRSSDTSLSWPVLAEPFCLVIQECRCRPAWFFLRWSSCRCRRRSRIWSWRSQQQRLEWPKLLEGAGLLQQLGASFLVEIWGEPVRNPHQPSALARFGLITTSWRQVTLFEGFRWAWSSQFLLGQPQRELSIVFRVVETNPAWVLSDWPRGADALASLFIASLSQLLMPILSYHNSYHSH